MKLNADFKRKIELIILLIANKIKRNPSQKRTLEIVGKYN